MTGLCDHGVMGCVFCTPKPEPAADYVASNGRASAILSALRRERKAAVNMTPEDFKFERWECVNDGTESHDGRDPEDPLAWHCPKCEALYVGPVPEQLPQRPWR
jgi:hypothetical protein